MFYIYVIHNLVTNQIYVGQTNKKRPEIRWRRHKSTAFGTNPKEIFYLHRSIKKYGVDVFTFTVIQKFINKEEAYRAERYWIKFYNSNIKEFGMNQTEGGEGAFGRVVKQETRDIMRVKRTGQRHTKEVILTKMSGENNCGAKLTEKDVIEIRERYKTMEWTQKQLADEFKVNATTIRHILNNRTWTHLGEYVYPGKTTIGYKNKAPIKFGSSHKLSKLTEQQVIEMREKHSTGNYTYALLAVEYKIHASTIRDIILRETWKHI